MQPYYTNSIAITSHIPSKVCRLMLVEAALKGHSEIPREDWITGSIHQITRQPHKERSQAHAGDTKLLPLECYP